MNRAIGNRYTVQGVVDLTDGYGDDNNRIGIYLFGDVPDLSGGGPQEDEAGALFLQINIDQNNVRIVEGLDRNVLNSVSKAGSLSGNALFGTTLTFLATIEFVDQAETDYIDIDFALTDANNDTTTVSQRVLAPTYTGSYFGFATRARNRGVTGKNAPFTMDYQSFSLSWDNAPISAYAQWAEDYGIGGDAALAGDFDGDRLTNLYEFALGGNPDDPMDRGVKPTFARSGDSACYIYPHRKETDELIYTVETSTSLDPGSWSATRYTLDGTDETDAAFNYSTLAIDTVEDQIFVRLKIEHQGDDPSP